MKNGYKILWTDHALDELKSTLEYLEENWSEKVIKKFVYKLEYTISLISKNPKIYPISNKKNVRRAVLERLISIYFRINGETIEILSLFQNRRSPKKNKF